MMAHHERNPSPPMPPGAVTVGTYRAEPPVSAPSTAPSYVAGRVAEWRGFAPTGSALSDACDLVTALSAELAAMRERAERAEADVHGLTGCEWPGCDQPSTSYRISSSWEGRLCERHNDRPALFPKESHDA